MFVHNKKTGRIYASIAEAARHLKISPSLCWIAVRKKSPCTRGRIALVDLEVLKPTQVMKKD